MSVFVCSDRLYDGYHFNCQSVCVLYWADCVSVFVRAYKL